MSMVLNQKLNIALLIGLIGFFQYIQCGGNFDTDTENSGSDLIFTHAVCRHGDRNIVEESYPNDPFKDEQKFWPEGYAQLTKLGKQQQYELGKYMRKRYAKLLGDGKYSPKKVYVQSTDSDRSLMSAESTVASLFPPFGDQLWNEDLQWMPIPIHTIPQDQDYILGVLKPCDRFDFEMAKYTNTTAYTSIFADYKAFIRHLEENSGKQLPRLLNILKLCDALSIERSRGFRLPAWTKQISENEIDNFYVRAFAIWTGTNTLKKFRSGFLLKDMLDRFTRTLHPRQPIDRSLRMHLYFAHDITIADMLNSLEIYMQHRPPLSSCLFFELYQSASDPYVQVYYKNSTEVHIPPLEIPKCGEKCALKKLYALYDHILPKNSYEEECALKEGEQMPPGGNPESYTLQ